MWYNPGVSGPENYNASLTSSPCPTNRSVRTPTLPASKLSKTSSWPSHQAARPSQARGEAWPVGTEAGRVTESGVWPLLRRPWASYTARRPHPTRPGLGGEREEWGNQPGGRSGGRGQGRAVRCTGRSIPSKAHCQFTHDKPFRVRSCPYWSSWVASSWLSSSQPNLSGCSSRDHSLWPSPGLHSLLAHSFQCR